MSICTKTSIIIFLSFISNILCAQEKKYFEEKITTTWNGNYDFFLKSGLIVYVSDENGNPQKNGNFFTLNNTTQDDIFYRMNSDNLDKYQKIDAARIYVTVSNVTTYYNIPPQSKLVRAIDIYKYKEQLNADVVLLLEIKYPGFDLEKDSLRFNAWNKTFSVNNKSAAQNKISDQSDSKIYYDRENKQAVIELLSKVKGWKIPSDANAKDGIAPVIQGDCIRDKYIAAALTYAYLAESYYRFGDLPKSDENAYNANYYVFTALQLCSNVPSFGGSTECSTSKIIPCSEKDNYTFINKNLQNSTDTQTKTYKENKTDDHKIYYSEGHSDAPVKPINYFPYSLLNISYPKKNADQELKNNIDAIAGTLQNAASISSLSERSAYVENTLTPLMDEANEKRKEKGISDIQSRDIEDKEKYGISLLEFSEAIRNDDTSLVNKAILAGFPLDQYVDEWDIKDFNNPGYYTALHLAAKYGSINCIRLLLKHGANMNVPVRKYIVQMGGNDDVRFFNYPATPLHVAVYFNQFEIVRYLLVKGASDDIKALCKPTYKEGYFVSRRVTPLELAQHLNLSSMIKLLQ